MSKIKVSILTRDKFRYIGMASVLIKDKDLIVQEKGNLEDEIEIVTKFMPDVVIFDMTTVKIELSAFMEACKELCPDTKVLMIGIGSEIGTDSEEDVIKALLTGVTGYLNILFFADNIVAAIKGVHKGDIWISHMIMRSLIGQLRSKLQKKVHFRTKITETERKVLQLLATEGLTNKEMGARLKIETRTVEFHITSLLRKFQVPNRNHLIIYAIKHNLVSFKLPTRTQP
ncbi:MAG: hypothetical protein DMG05_19070 [Acidobacteria bacterium]|nr:MAG: hypothetical protein DMG05_19070 [Acidobacteriota bacterium]